MESTPAVRLIIAAANWAEPHAAGYSHLRWALAALSRARLGWVGDGGGGGGGGQNRKLFEILFEKIWHRFCILPRRRYKCNEGEGGAVQRNNYHVYIIE